jgi:hypothetical protein
MRHVKMACGLATAVCAFGVAAAPALAEGPEFLASINGQTISPTEPAITKGKFAGEPHSKETTQEFKFGEFLIKCEKVVSKGEITAPASPTFETTLKFQGCGYYPKPANPQHFAATFSTSGITLLYHVNGYAKIEGNSEGEEQEYGSSKVTILETAALVKIPNAKYCTIILPEQTVPAKAIKHPEEEFSSALYSEESVPAPGKKKLFPEGEQKKLLITNEFKGLKYKFAEETQCGEDQKATEGSTGVFKGNILEEVVKGNFSVEEPEI